MAQHTPTSHADQTTEIGRAQGASKPPSPQARMEDAVEHLTRAVGKLHVLIDTIGSHPAAPSCEADGNEYSGLQGMLNSAPCDIHDRAHAIEEAVQTLQEMLL